jgi:hypothetical protein
MRPLARFWKREVAAVIVACASAGCRAPVQGQPAASKAASATVPASAGQFESDVEFLRQHTPIVVLRDGSAPAQVAIAPAYQARVMTSTPGGSDAPSSGWLGRAAIASGSRQPHINVFGGEDRFWLGPEGGQYSLYFKRGDPFDLAHWQVPAALDWDQWETTGQTQTSASFHKRMALVNYSGTTFEIDVARTVRLLNAADVTTYLGETPGAGVRVVAFESSNTVTNTGSAPWQERSGLVSAWILGMFKPSPATVIAIPFAGGPADAVHPVVNDRYFGKVPADRLAVKGSVIFFKGDGEYRSKIGLPPSRALSVAGSYDAAAHLLTLIQYTRPATAAPYVNSMWETQRDPYNGDVLNSYNDGPPAPGAPPLGPFYEMETSSPALALRPGERYTHVHRTFHLAGPEQELDRITRATLKIGIADLKSAF